MPHPRHVHGPVRPRGETRGGEPGILPASAPAPVPPAAPDGTAVRCHAHPNVEATARCAVCRKPVCSTCAFVFADRTVACPTCATSEPETFTPRRRRMMIGSYVLAAVVTAFYGLLFTGMLFSSDRAYTETEGEARGHPNDGR